MGAGNILENNIKAATSSFWFKVPALGVDHFLDLDLSRYHKSFVNLAVIAGVATVAHATLKATKSIIKASQIEKVPSSKQLLDKYGHHSWAVISDCRGSEDYAKFLAEKGFNLILMGNEQDIQIAKEMAEKRNSTIEFDCIPVDWKKHESNLEFYNELMARLKDYDISMLVLPRMVFSKEVLPSHIEHIQPFAHVYLLVRFFCPKLTWRSYMSAMIFPSWPQEELTAHNGTTKGIVAGIDAFGRIMSHEQKVNFDSVVARGSVEEAFKALGKRPISN